MSKKWMPFAIAAVVVGVGFLVWRIFGTVSGSDETPSVNSLVNEIPKPPPGTKPFDKEPMLPPGVPAPKGMPKPNR